MLHLRFNRTPSSGRLSIPSYTISPIPVNTKAFALFTNPGHAPILPRMQNTSHAVMAQRHESRYSLDYFPTPPWATRALMEHIITDPGIGQMTCLEPACGEGHMAMALNEYFRHVDCFDIEDYGYGMVQNFLTYNPENPIDWIITNPPFILAQDFVLHALNQATRGVAILARTLFLESFGRYNAIFRRHRPTTVAQFVERVPMVKGRLDKHASTATSYCWLVWDKSKPKTTELEWIPPCRKNLDKSTDYEKKPGRLSSNRGSLEIFSKEHSSKVSGFSQD